MTQSGSCFLCLSKGHTQPRTTQRYAHLADDPPREASEKIGRVITGAGKPGAEIRHLRGQGS
jgi:hypothetical protein